MPFVGNADDLQRGAEVKEYEYRIAGSGCLRNEASLL